MKWLDAGAWAIFLGLGAVLWASGVRLFLRSSLSGRWKAGWTAVLVSVGVAIGCVLPLPGIRDRFLALLALLPLLAVIDLALARSNRRLGFWLRACSFEICTVFGIAAITRLTIERITSVP
jgi:hypothetical protein